MSKAARAIIIENGNILVMYRNKRGKEYFTLVGGLAKSDEPIEQALVREVKEETGLDITGARLVFTENHPEPYNQQYVFLCEVAPHEQLGLQTGSEEALMNRIDTNFHAPRWVDARAFEKLTFLTVELQKAILKGIKKGFPDQPQPL